MFEQDYIMRLIHQIVRFLMNLLFRRKGEEDEEVRQQDQQGDLLLHGAKAEKYDRLMDMVQMGQVNEAENQLYEDMDTADMEELKLALLFYDAVNELSNEELKQFSYTREEIREGIAQVLEKYGYSGLGDALSEEISDVD